MTDLDTTHTGTVVTSAIDRMAQFHAYMLARAEQEKSNRPDSLAEEIAAKNMEQIFAAAEKEDDESGEALWDAGSGGAIQGRNCIPDEGGTGLEIEIRGWRPDVSTRTFEDQSGEDQGKGYYVTIDAVCLGGPRDLLRKLALSPGQEFALQTGADDIIFRLRGWEIREQKTGKTQFPVRGVLVGVKTGSDNKVLKLKPMPTRTVQA